MTLIEEIRAKFVRDRFEFSKHATDQIILREISLQEIREAVATGDIIEDYPDDKYGPSCLILGFTRSRRPVHLLCSYPSRLIIKVVTAYEPDTEYWVNYQIRR